MKNLIILIILFFPPILVLHAQNTQKPKVQLYSSVTKTDQEKLLHDHEWSKWPMLELKLPAFAFDVMFMQWKNYVKREDCIVIMDYDGSILTTYYFKDTNILYVEKTIKVKGKDDVVLEEFRFIDPKYSGYYKFVLDPTTAIVHGELYIPPAEFQKIFSMLAHK